MQCSSSLIIGAPPPGRRKPTTTALNPTLRRRSSSAVTMMSLNPTPKPPDPILTSIANLLWGQSLPPGLLISTVRSAWHSTWRLMMSRLAPSDPSGSYTRPQSRFRRPSLTTTTSLRLYVGLPCPWAHRALLVSALKGLQGAVPVSVARPGEDGSWRFGPGGDGPTGCGTLREVYGMRRGGYDGRATVPMLWDVDGGEVVCNESYDIAEILNSDLNSVAGNPGLDLSPPELKDRIEEWNRVIYPNVNNGVYRCGFAQSQEAYDRAVSDLFNTLEVLEAHLGGSRYLCDDRLTLADVCLFTTLVRFDLVYHGLFKCSKKKLIEYPNLHAYLRDLYQIPGVAETCDFTAIMDGYYKMLFPLNPGNICPAIPAGCDHEALCRPHNRDSLSLVAT